VTVPVVLRLLGYFLGVCALVAIVKTAIDTYQENEHAKWPSVVATITQQTVRQAFAGKLNSSGTRYVWYIQSELRYSANGEELTSSIRSRVTESTEQRAMMRTWASQHQPGTSLPVRYDPLHHSTVVPDAGDMPESGLQAQDDLKLILIFLLPSTALMTFGRVLQRRQARKQV
jgi:hypothetical protein